MKPNRAPSQVWALRKDLVDYVRTMPNDRVRIVVRGEVLDMDRPTARLLARRIMQCLDETRR